MRHQWVFFSVFFFCGISALGASPPPTASPTPTSTASQAEGIKVDDPRFQLPVIKQILSNGLTVLILPDHTAPEVSSQIWFKVGSRNETPGFTGIAHLFEHMMFKGGAKYDEKAFNLAMASNGVDYNAYTTNDYTSYYEDYTPPSLDLVFDIDSDRVGHLALTAEHLKSEKEVVKEERRWRVDNSESGLLREALWAHAFIRHPYGWPVIGWMRDIDAIDLKRCQEFFHNYYNVSNAVLTVVGDVQTAPTMKQIQKFFGPLPSAKVPKTALPLEPKQTSERRVEIAQKFGTPEVMIAYHGVKQSSPDSYPLDLLSYILAEGESSRLYTRLVYEKQWATSVQVNDETPLDAGLFTVDINLRPNVDPSTVINEVQSVLNDVAHQQVTASELEKAKNQMLKHWVDSLKTIHNKANAIALYEVLTGDYHNLYTDMTKYPQTTAADITRVAKKYLRASGRTVAIARGKS